MKNMGEESGFTVVELLVSMTIMSVVLMMAWGFFSQYEEKTYKLAEYENARNVLVNEVEEYLIHYQNGGELEQIERSVELRGMVYEVEINYREVTEELEMWSNEFQMVEVSGKVEWGSNSTEVVSYVSD